MSKDEFTKSTKIIGKLVQSYEYECIRELNCKKGIHRTFGLSDLLPDKAVDRAFSETIEWGGMSGQFEITVRFTPNNVKA
jgi:hypothetical protein